MGSCGQPPKMISNIFGRRTVLDPKINKIACIPLLYPPQQIFRIRSANWHDLPYFWPSWQSTLLSRPFRVPTLYTFLYRQRPIFVHSFIFRGKKGSISCTRVVYQMPICSRILTCLGKNATNSLFICIRIVHHYNLSFQSFGKDERRSLVLSSISFLWHCSWGQSGGTLASVCASPSVDVVSIAFLNVFFSTGGLPSINLASSCNGPVFKGTNLLQCPQVGYSPNDRSIY